MQAPRRVVICLAAALAAAGVAVGQEPIRFVHEPALSPDGRLLAFTWAGDVWSVPTTGGRASRLTNHPADDGNPTFSPDGTLLAFTSNRAGNYDVYLMASGGSAPRRLTFHAGSDGASGFTPDGKQVLFASRRYGPVAGPNRMEFLVPIEGGTPRRLQPVEGSVGQFSPDGTKLVFVRGGVGASRRGYRGPAAEEIWLHDLTNNTYRPLASHPAVDTWPQWAADGRSIYFASDRDGVRNLYRLQLEDGTLTPVTRHAEPIGAPTISRDGRTIAYEHQDQIWVLDQHGDRPVNITAAADPVEPTEDWRTLTGGVTEFAVAPSGKEVAFVVRGDVYITRYPEGGPTTQLTDTAAEEGGLSWTPDSAALWYHSDRGGQFDLYTVSSGDPTEPRLRLSRKLETTRRTQHSSNEYDPQVSPDGKRVAYIHGQGDLVVAKADLTDIKVLNRSWASPHFEWSPDSRWLAFSRSDSQFNYDVFILNADGGEPVNVSQHPRADYAPTWSGDGSKLGFLSQRNNDQVDAYFVWLRTADWEKTKAERVAEEDEAYDRPRPRPASPPATPGAPPTAPAAPAAPAPGTTAPAPTPAPAAPRTDPGPTPPKTEPPAGQAKPEPGAAPAAPSEAKPEPKKLEIDLEGIHQRVARLTTSLNNEASLDASPDGKGFAYVLEKDGRREIFTQNWDETTPKQVTSGGGAVGVEWSPDGKTLRYLREGGRVAMLPAAGGPITTASFEAVLHRKAGDERAYLFDAVWRTMRDEFYDPAMHGVNWEAVRDRYRPRAAAAPTRDDFDLVVNQMLGELNSSHVGFYRAGSAPSGVAAGELGVAWDDDRGEPGLKVAAVVPHSPADRQSSRLTVGDRVTAVNGQVLGTNDNVNELLLGQTDRLVRLDVRNAAGETRTVDIRPIRLADLDQLRYRAWVEARRREVEKQSEGRVGYVHLAAMDEASLATFERDLYAAGHGKGALIVDVRWNSGGWTADVLLGMLMVRHHAYTVPRGGEAGYPLDRLLAPAWTGPTVLMTNGFSVSNAEILAHAFRTLKRGPVVGTPTYGGVISTGQTTLVDGSVLRLPTRGWYRATDRLNLENNPAEPDILVDITPQDEAAGRDPQLEAAVKAAVGQLSGGANDQRGAAPKL